MENGPVINLSTLAKHFSDEGEAYLLMEQIRWPNGPTCPHCGTEDRCYYLQPKNGVRRTSTGAVSHRRLWKCGACRKQFSVLVGTIFEDSKVPLSKWLMAVYLMTASKNGVAAFELHRTLGVTNKTAWFMCHRIREAMTSDPLAGMLSGTVVADETFIGGSDRNRKKSARHPRIEKTDTPIQVVPGQRQKQSAGGKDRKVPVLSLIDTETGEVRSRVVTDVTGATLRKVIAENVDMANTVLMTDEGMQYRVMRSELAGHVTVNHSNDEYVRYEGGRVITTNHAEGYFSQLKRSIDGTHHHVSRTHLPRYLAEFDYRYSTRKLSDSQRTMLTIRKGGGKRLTYR